MRFLLIFLGACAVSPVKEIPAVKKTSAKEIQTMAAASSCAKYKWKNRSVAPTGYMQGMALVYAKALCQEGKSNNVLLNQAPRGPGDALVHLGIKPKVSALRTTYTLMLGLGMRESSGDYCEGRDYSAGESSGMGTTCEAGTFQTSFNARVFSAELPKLWAAPKKGCLLEVFKQGVTCTDRMLKNWGTGEGLKFQEVSKSCPSFAAEFAAVVVRSKYQHYGPLKRKEAEYRPECEDMLAQVELLVGPEVCAELTQ